jgi:uncharacterized protein (DUF433 family)
VEVRVLSWAPDFRRDNALFCDKARPTRHKSVLPFAGKRAARRQEQTMSTQDRVEVNPKVMLGKPVIRGTRITVELILRKLGDGASHQELLDAYPHLTERDLQAAITYAADTLAHEETVLLEPQG